MTTLVNLAWLHFDDVGSNREQPQPVRIAALRRSLEYYAQAFTVAKTLSRKDEAYVLVQKALVTLRSAVQPRA